MTRVVPFLLLAFLAWPTAARAQEIVAVDTVLLRFDWPDEIDARVVATSYRERNAETVDTVRASMSYRMSVRPHADGLSITYSDFGMEGLTSPLALQEMQELIGGMMPGIVVDRSGQFLRIADLAQIEAMLDSMFGAISDSAGTVREAVDRMISPELLTALTAQEWNGLVGFWAGAELEIGALYTLQEDVELPFIPGSRVPMISDIAINGRVSCVAEGHDEDCIEARIVSYPDEQAVAAEIQRFVQGFAPGESPPFRIDYLDMETEVILVTDPETLLPHWYRTTRWTTGTGSDETGSGEFSQLDVKTYEYTYEATGGAP